MIHTGDALILRGRRRKEGKASFGGSTVWDL